MTTATVETFFDSIKDKDIESYNNCKKSHKFTENAKKTPKITKNLPQTS